MKKFLLMLLLVVGICGTALAGAYDIKEMTPAVKSALEGRRDRFDQLVTLKAQGLVGENNSGYVQALGGGADVKSLVSAENANRKLIYKAIVEQNELGAGALATVEAVFAGVQRDKASPGDKIQDAAGNWSSK